MIAQVVVKAKAREEIAASAAWYEARRTGLGLEFLDALERALDRVAEAPTQFPLYDGSVRRVLLRRFPFGVYYEAAGDAVYVLSVLRLTRRPDRWRTG